MKAVDGQQPFCTKEKVILVLVLTALAGLVAFPFFMMFVEHGVQDLFADKTTDRTTDWDQFYQREVRHYFTLPHEVKVFKATHTATAIMGGRVHVTFRLPATKRPEEWLEGIAGESGLARYKVSDLLYDCEERDLWRLEYLPDKKLYVAEWGWD